MRTLTVLLLLGAAPIISGCTSPKTALQKGVDLGYQQANSDQVKRRYWQKQHAANNQKGRMVYYTFDESGKQDTPGQKRAPGSKVTVPVYEPLPVK